MSESKFIKVVGAKVHNLKNIDISIPKHTLTTITGPSGSGKSSLAFDTLYVEGQRRYIESLSSYARQFLGQFSPPDVESITGLSPSIAINQKTIVSNPRSTVGTITEVYDYIRVLFARVGTLYCLESGEEVKSYTPAKIVKDILSRPKGKKVVILSPLPFKTRAECSSLVSKHFSLGFSRYRVNGKIRSYEDHRFVEQLSPKSIIEVVVDRFVIKENISKRCSDSVEYALRIGRGCLGVLVEEKEFFYSEQNMAQKSKRIYPNLEPRLFSFNSPQGACPCCNGLGQSKSFDQENMISDDNISIPEGAIGVLSKRNSFLLKMVQCVAKEEGVDLNSPLKALPVKFVTLLFEGGPKVYRYSFESENTVFKFSRKFPGIIKWVDRKYRETSSERVRASLTPYMDIKVCPDCQGQRLNKTALNTRVGGKNIAEICEMPLKDSLKFIKTLELEGEKKLIARKLVREITSRLRFLNDVGLGYLCLNRSASTLSGGESQRIRLATQIGSHLSGVLYVLDEPSIGLHQRDNLKLFRTLKRLRDLGNTVIIVEHDEEAIRTSDFVVDLGPGAGNRGGHIVAKGDLKSILGHRRSLTAAYLSGRKAVVVSPERRTPSSFMTLTGGEKNNIRNLDVVLPLGVIVSISGVSGSGKSTLIHDILAPALRQTLARRSGLFKRPYRKLEGVEKIDSLVELDQSPIGRTPHSNPATYTGLFDLIRTLFSQTSESKIRGYQPGRFSFNVKGGRCGECEGHGVKKIEMHFLPAVYITCNECGGSRYNGETLSISYKGKNIAEVLSMEVHEALKFFGNHPGIVRILETLESVGLGYMKLGQSATTLSGGEAQRLKLSRELAKKKRGHCLYMLDEPTTGLHFEDIRILLSALSALVSRGHSIIVIEHNLDVLKSADYIVDLGPEGGEAGGRIVAQGTPEQVARAKNSHTGKFLGKHLP